MSTSRGRHLPGPERATGDQRVECGNFLPPAMRISRRPPLLESRCPFRCAALRSKKNRCAVCSDTTNTTQLSALPGSFSPRTAGWLTKQAGSQSNATQRKQRTATQKPWSCRELRRRKIEERFGCRTHLVNRAAFAMRAAENYSSEPDLWMLQLHQAQKREAKLLQEPPLFHPSTAKCTTHHLQADLPTWLAEPLHSLPREMSQTRLAQFEEK